MEERRVSIDTLKGHEKKVLTLSWNKDGALLASGSSDKTIRLWSLKGSQVREAACFRGHESALEQILFSPTERNALVSISNEKDVVFWDARTGRKSYVVKTDGSNINLAWSPDGRYVAVGNKDDKLVFIDTQTRAVALARKFSYEVNQVRWNVSGDLLFMAATQSRSKGVIQLFKFEGGTNGETPPVLTYCREMKGHTSDCYAVDVDPTGRYLASGSADALVCIWDARDFACKRTISRMEWPVQTINFSYDGKYLVSGSEDLHIDIADANTGDLVWRQGTKGMTFAATWHPKAHLLAYSSDAAPGRHPGEINLLGIN